MNAILATNVKTFRTQKNWTQEHLAEASGVQLRTIQRIEGGEGCSKDTLGALANVFDVSVDALSFDFAKAEDAITKAFDAGVFPKTHEPVRMTPVTCVAEWSAIEGTHASMIECAAKDDVVQDTFAALKAELLEVADLWSSVDPITHLEWMRSLYDKVREINGLGFVVAVGRKEANVRGSKALSLYVVVWAEDAVKDWIAAPL